MPLKKLVSYFILWNFVLQNTLSLCAYAIGPLEIMEAPSALRRIGGVLVPHGKAERMKEALTVSRAIFGEHTTSFETPEDLSFYLPDNLYETGLEEKALMKKRQVDILWGIGQSKAWFNNPEELALYLKGPMGSTLWEQLLKARAQKETLGGLFIKDQPPLSLKGDVVVSVKALPGRFVGLSERRGEGEMEAGAGSVIDSTVDPTEDQRRLLLHAIQTFSGVERLPSGIEILVAQVAPTGEVLSKAVKRYRGEDLPNHEETLSFMGRDNLRFESNGDLISFTLDESLGFSISLGKSLKITNLQTAMPVRLESPWPIKFFSSNKVSSLSLKAPSINHKLGTLSGKTYEAMLTDPRGVWRNSGEISGLGGFSLWGGEFNNSGSLELYGNISSVHTYGFYNTGAILIEDMGKGSGLRVNTRNYSQGGRLEMDTLEVVASNDYSNKGKTTLKGTYNLTVDKRGDNDGETTAGNLYLRGKGRFLNNGTIDAEDTLSLTIKGFTNGISTPTSAPPEIYEMSEGDWETLDLDQQALLIATVEDLLPSLPPEERGKYGRRLLKYLFNQEMFYDMGFSTAGILLTIFPSEGELNQGLLALVRDSFKKSFVEDSLTLARIEEDDEWDAGWSSLKREEEALLIATVEDLLPSLPPQDRTDYAKRLLKYLFTKADLDDPTLANTDNVLNAIFPREGALNQVLLESVSEAFKKTFVSASLTAARIKGDLESFRSIGRVRGREEISLRVKEDLFLYDPLESQGSLSIFSEGKIYNATTLLGKERVRIEGGQFFHTEDGIVASNNTVLLKGGHLSLSGQFFGVRDGKVDSSSDVPVLKVFLNEDTPYNPKHLRARDRLHLVLDPGGNFERDIETPGFLDIEVQSKKDMTLSATFTAPKGIHIRGPQIFSIGERDDGEVYKGNFITDSLNIEADHVHYRAGVLDQVASMALNVINFDVWEDLTLGQLGVKAKRMIIHKKEDGSLPLISTTRKTGEGAAPLKDGEPSLSLEAEELDLKHGQIAAAGPLVLRQTGEKTLEFGERFIVEAQHDPNILPIPQGCVWIGFSVHVGGDWNHLNPAYKKNKSNGFFIASSGSLSIFSSGNFMNNMGRLYSGGVLSIESLKDIENLSGSFQGDLGVLIKGENFRHTRLPQTKLLGFVFDSSYTTPEFNFDVEDPAYLESASGDIRFDLTKGVLNEASNIFAAGSIFYNGATLLDPSTPLGEHPHFTMISRTQFGHALCNGGENHGDRQFSPTLPHVVAAGGARFSHLGLFEIRGGSIHCSTIELDNVKLARMGIFNEFQTTFGPIHASPIIRPTITDNPLFKKTSEGPTRMWPVLGYGGFMPQIETILGSAGFEDTRGLRFAFHPLQFQEGFVRSMMHNYGQSLVKKEEGSTSKAFERIVSAYGTFMENLRGNLEGLDGNKKAAIMGAVGSYLKTGGRHKPYPELPDLTGVTALPRVQEIEGERVLTLDAVVPHSIRNILQDKSTVLYAEEEAVIENAEEISIRGARIDAGALHLASTGLLNLQANVTNYTTGGGENTLHHRHVTPTELVARRGDVSLMGKTLLTGSTKIESYQNVVIDVLGSHDDEAFHEVVETREVSRKGRKTTEHSKRVEVPIPTEIVARGNIYERVGESINLEAASIRSNGSTLEAGHSITLRESHRIIIDTIFSTHKGGAFGGNRQRQERSTVGTSIGAYFEGPTVLSAPLVHLSHVRARDQLDVFAEETWVRAPSSMRTYSLQESNSNLLRVSGKTRTEESLTYGAIDLSNIQVRRGRVVVEHGQGQDLDLLRAAFDPSLELRLLSDHRRSHFKSYSAPGVLTNIIITAAITAAMPGVGTGLTASMSQAAFSAAASQVAIGTLSNGGDIGAGLRGVLSRSGLESIAIAMATAGLIEGIEYVLPESLKGPQSLTTQRSIEQHLASGLGKSMAGGLAGAAFGRGFDVEDVLGTGFVAGLGALGANMICDWYRANPNHYVIHKGFHFGGGALMGALLSPPNDRISAALAGGIGAATAEMMAEGLGGGPSDLVGRRITPDSIKGQLVISKMIGGIAGSLMGQGVDPSIAFMTAHNAVENNYLEMVMRANGTMETRVVDDKSHPEDAVHVIIENSEAGQTRSFWHMQKEDPPLTPEVLAFLSMGGGELLSDDLRSDVRHAYFENPTLYKQNLYGGYQDATNAYLGFRRSIVDAGNFQGLRDHYKSQHPEMRSLMDIQLGWGDVLSVFMPETKIEAVLLLAAGPITRHVVAPAIGGVIRIGQNSLSGMSRVVGRYGQRGNGAVETGTITLRGEVSGLDSLNKLPYNARQMEMLLSRHCGKVESSTLPKTTGRNVSLAGRRHPTTGVVFDTRGFPIFDGVAVFETRIGKTLGSGLSEAHKREATTHLRIALEKGEILTHRFSSRQLSDIQKGKSSIEGYAWHHHQESGRMQLIDRSAHESTGHVGGFSMWGKVHE